MQLSTEETSPTLVYSLVHWLRQNEIWLASLLVGLSIISNKILPYTAMALALFWVVRWVDTRQASVRTPVDWLVVLLILMASLSLWVTIQPEVTQPQILRLLIGIEFFYTLVNWTVTHTRVKQIIWEFELVGLGLALIAPFTVRWPEGKLLFLPTKLYSLFPQMVSDTIHPNVIAGFLVILLPLPIALMVFAFQEFPNRLERFLLGCSIILMLVILTLTQSRGAWIALGIVGVMILFFRIDRRLKWIMVAAGIMVALGAIVWLGPTQLSELLLANSSLGSFESRLEVWSRALIMIRDFPLSGIGMGSFGKLIDTYYPLFLSPPDSVPHAHNLFLQMALDLGLPGLIAWLALFGTCVIIAWKVYRMGHLMGDNWLLGLGIGLLGSQLAMAVHGLTDAVTWGMVKPSPLVWFVWGLVIAAGRVYLICQKTNGKENANQKVMAESQ